VKLHLDVIFPRFRWAPVLVGAAVFALTVLIVLGLAL